MLNTFEEFKADLDKCIHHCNKRRRQVRLKGLTPEVFREQALSIVVSINYVKTFGAQFKHEVFCSLCAGTSYSLGDPFVSSLATYEVFSHPSLAPTMRGLLLLHLFLEDWCGGEAR